MTDPTNGEWARLDESPAASAQMIRWYAPETARLLETVAVQELAPLLHGHATFGWDGDSNHRCRCGEILTGRPTTDPIPAWTRHVIKTLADANLGDVRARRAMELRRAAEARRQRANVSEACGLPNAAQKARDRAFRLLDEAEALEA